MTPKSFVVLQRGLVVTGPSTRVSRAERVTLRDARSAWGVRWRADPCSTAAARRATPIERCAPTELHPKWKNHAARARDFTTSDPALTLPVPTHHPSPFLGARPLAMGEHDARPTVSPLRGRRRPSRRRGAPGAHPDAPLGRRAVALGRGRRLRRHRTRRARPRGSRRAGRPRSRRVQVRRRRPSRRQRRRRAMGRRRLPRHRAHPRLPQRRPRRARPRRGPDPTHAARHAPFVALRDIHEGARGARTRRRPKHGVHEPCARGRVGVVFVAIRDDADVAICDVSASSRARRRAHARRHFLSRAVSLLGRRRRRRV